MAVGIDQVNAGRTADEWLTEAHREHFARLVMVGTFLTGDRGAAEDLAQEIFLSGFRRIRDEGYRIGPAWPWLRGSMARGAANWRRSAGRRRAREQAVRQDDVIVEAWDGLMDIENALRRLPRRMQACARLVYVRGLTYKEAGILLGCSAETVHRHLLRARPRLRRWLTVEEPADRPVAEGARPAA